MISAMAYKLPITAQFNKQAKRQRTKSITVNHMYIFLSCQLIKLDRYTKNFQTCFEMKFAMEVWQEDIVNMNG
jgi:hypothetical protein